MEELQKVKALYFGGTPRLNMVKGFLNWKVRSYCFKNEAEIVELIGLSSRFKYQSKNP